MTQKRKGLNEPFEKRYPNGFDAMQELIKVHGQEKANKLLQALITKTLTIQSELKTPHDHVCYEIANNDELFDHIAFYVSGDPEGLNDYPEVTKKLEDVLKKMKPFKPIDSSGHPMDLYRGESKGRKYENYREVESWTPNKETALDFAKNVADSAVRKTVGAVQGFSLESLVSWRMLTHPNENHYSGGQSEWLILRPKNVKTVYTEDKGWSFGEELAKNEEKFYPTKWRR